MKFKYRGAEYQDQVAVDEPIETNYLVQYRGQTYQASQSSSVPSQAATGLSYRGVPYQVNQVGQPVTLSPRERANLSRQTPKPVQVQSHRAVHVKEQLVNSTSQVHRRSLAKVLERRIQIARAKRDTRLMHQLAEEMRALGLS